MGDHRNARPDYIACTSAVVFVMLSLQPTAPVMAADALGMYIGGSIGQEQVEADSLPSPIARSGIPTSFGNFEENH